MSSLRILWRGRRANHQEGFDCREKKEKSPQKILNRGVRKGGARRHSSWGRTGGEKTRKKKKTQKKKARATASCDWAKIRAIRRRKTRKPTTKAGPGGKTF